MWDKKENNCFWIERLIVNLTEELSLREDFVLHGHLLASIFWLLWITLLWMWLYKYFWAPAFHSFGCIPRSGIAGSNDNSIFNFFVELPYCFPQQLCHFTFPSVIYECPISPCPCQHSFSFFFNLKFYLFMVTPSSLWNLSSPTMDWTQALSSESTFLTIGPPGNSPSFSLV